MEKTKIEGLLIKKILFKERDIIAHILLRSGNLQTVLFYGGQGGGVKKKSSSLELGHMLKIELSSKGKKNSAAMKSAKEYSVLWWHEKIRPCFQSFYMMCLFLEIAAKIATESCLEDEDENLPLNAGIFNSLSNALFLLNSNPLQFKQQMIDDKSIGVQQLSFYLGKLCHTFGVFPLRDNCLFCAENIHHHKDVYFIAEQGGFSCSFCFSGTDKMKIAVNDRELYLFLGRVKELKYADFSFETSMPKDLLKKLLRHFCYQLNLKENDFKSLKMLPYIQ